MATVIEIVVPSPLSDCFLHSETICVRECCGIDAISDDPELVAQWGRSVGYPVVRQAHVQLVELIALVQNRTGRIALPFLNASADGEVTGEALLSFLQAFEVAFKESSHERSADTR